MKTLLWSARSKRSFHSCTLSPRPDRFLSLQTGTNVASHYKLFSSIHSLGEDGRHSQVFPNRDLRLKHQCWRKKTKHSLFCVSLANRNDNDLPPDLVFPWKLKQIICQTVTACLLSVCFFNEDSSSIFNHKCRWFNSLVGKHSSSYELKTCLMVYCHLFQYYIYYHTYLWSYRYIFPPEKVCLYKQRCASEHLLPESTADPPWKLNKFTKYSLY